MLILYLFRMSVAALKIVLINQPSLCAQVKTVILNFDE